MAKQKNLCVYSVIHTIMHMCQTTVESFKIISNEYVSSSTNATNCRFWFMNGIENL